MNRIQIIITAVVTSGISILVSYIMAAWTDWQFLHEVGAGGWLIVIVGAAITWAWYLLRGR